MAKKSGAKGKKTTAKKKTSGVLNLPTTCVVCGLKLSPRLRKANSHYCGKHLQDFVVRLIENDIIWVTSEPTGEVFIEVWSEPLMTAGSSTLLDDVLQILGLKNCYSDQSSHFQVDPEDVVSRTPAIILRYTNNHRC